MIDVGKPGYDHVFSSPFKCFLTIGNSQIPYIPIGDHMSCNNINASKESSFKVRLDLKKPSQSVPSTDSPPPLVETAPNAEVTKQPSRKKKTLPLKSVNPFRLFDFVVNHAAQVETIMSKNKPRSSRHYFWIKFCQCDRCKVSSETSPSKLRSKIDRLPPCPTLEKEGHPPVLMPKLSGITLPSRVIFKIIPLKLSIEIGGDDSHTTEDTSSTRPDDFFKKSPKDIDLQRIVETRHAEVDELDEFGIRVKKSESKGDALYLVPEDDTQWGLFPTTVDKKKAPFLHALLRCLRRRLRIPLPLTEATDGCKTIRDMVKKDGVSVGGLPTIGCVLRYYGATNARKGIVMSLSKLYTYLKLDQSPEKHTPSVAKEDLVRKEDEQPTQQPLVEVEEPPVSVVERRVDEVMDEVQDQFESNLVMKVLTSQHDLHMKQHEVAVLDRSVIKETNSHHGKLLNALLESSRENNEMLKELFERVTELQEINSRLLVKVGENKRKRGVFVGRNHQEEEDGYDDYDDSEEKLHKRSKNNSGNAVPSKAPRYNNFPGGNGAPSGGPGKTVGYLPSPYPPDGEHEVCSSDESHEKMSQDTHSEGSEVDIMSDHGSDDDQNTAKTPTQDHIGDGNLQDAAGNSNILWENNEDIVDEDVVAMVNALGAHNSK